MRSIILTIVFIVPLFALSQNLPECDSVVINCCAYQTYNPSTVDIEVSNYSSNIFSYPGFILFNLDMDTIAKETVNYYGIGWNQIHSLNILHPFDLPFEGILELHTGFYNSHLCTFPITIPDTVQTSIASDEFIDLLVYPNPVNDILTIKIKDEDRVRNIQIFDLHGKIILELPDLKENSVNVSNLNSGVYFLHLSTVKGENNRIKLIKK